MTQITPAQEDPIVHGYLNTLTPFAPRAGFADRVLAEVVRPAPAWLRSIQHVYRTVVNRETRWVLATGIAASAVFSFAVYFTIAVRHWPQVETAWATFVRTGMPDAFRSLAGVGTAASTLLSVADRLATVPGLWPAAAAGTLFVMMGSAWGLRRTMRQFQAERIPARAAR